jgi:hypothetical protein
MALLVPGFVGTSTGVASSSAPLRPATVSSQRADAAPVMEEYNGTLYVGWTGGRKRGEVVRTRTTVLQAHTHQWLCTFSDAGNGDHRGDLLRASANGCGTCASNWVIASIRLPCARPNSLLLSCCPLPSLNAPNPLGSSTGLQSSHGQHKWEALPETYSPLNLMGRCVVQQVNRSMRKSDAPNAMTVCASCMLLGGPLTCLFTAGTLSGIWKRYQEVTSCQCRAVASRWTTSRTCRSACASSNFSSDSVGRLESMPDATGVDAASAQSTGRSAGISIVSGFLPDRTFASFSRRASPLAFEIDLADCQVVGGVPILVYQVETRLVNG